VLIVNPKMSTRFDALDKEYNQLIQKVETNVASLAQQTPEDRSRLEKEVKADLVNAESLISQLDFEVRGMQSTHRQAMSRRCQTYREDVKKLREGARKAIASASEAASRDKLMELGESGRQRQQMESSTQRLNNSTERIQRAKQQVVEIEDTGLAIATELEAQRSKIEHARGGIGEANLIISKSKRLLHGMVRRMKQNKVLMYFIIVALFVMIVCIVYFKWIKK
jgi:vesicle transport through interaction with t-SNAREs protein 1